MKHEPLLKVAPFSGSRVQPFEGTRSYLSTGDLQETRTSFVQVTYLGKPSRADISVSCGDVLFARMKGTKKVLEIDQSLSNIIVSTGFAVLRPTEECDGKFLSIYFKSDDFERQKEKYCAGAIQPAITNAGINKITIPFPPPDDQKRIAHLLGKVDGLIARRKQHLHQLDDLIKSVFVELFGDPVQNKMGWERPELKEFGKISTGNTPPRKDPSNYSSQHIEWIKTDNISTDSIFISQAAESLSVSGTTRARTVTKGALMVACIAGSVESIGRAALTNRTVAFNQQINSIQPNKDVNPFYLYVLFKISKAYIQSHASKGMKKILTKGEFEKITMIKPPVVLQNQFAAIVEKVEGLKYRYQKSLTELENLYGVLCQEAFKGELDLSRIALSKDQDEDEKQKVKIEPIVVTKEQGTHLVSPKAFSRRVHESVYSDGIKPTVWQWFSEYFEKLGPDADFSLTMFMEENWGKILELDMEGLQEPEDDIEFEFEVEDYNQLKGYVFHALNTGCLKQEFDEASNRIRLVVSKRSVN